jgi:opacity protein-like surface antigen
MKRVVTAFALFAALATAAPAAAQRIDSPYRFLDHNQHAGVFAGHVAAASGRLELGPEPAIALGARWGIRVSGPFAAGVEVAYMPTTRVVRDTVFVAADSLYEAVGEASMRLLSVMGTVDFSLVGQRTWNGLRPLLTAGVGGVIDLAGTAAAEAEFEPGVRYNFGTSFAGQFGAAVEWFPSQRVSVRVDARNVLWKLGVPEAFGLTEAGRQLSRSDWEGNFALMAGLSYHF